MNIVWELSRFELTLLIRSRGFWITAGLMGVFTAYLLLLEGSMHSGMIHLLALWMLFLTIPVMARDTEAAFAETMVSCCHSHLVMLTARAIAIFLALAGIGVALAGGAYIAARCMFSDAPLPVIPLVFLVKYLTVCANITGISCFIGSMVKKSLWLYGLFFSLWFVLEVIASNTVFAPNMAAAFNLLYNEGLRGEPSPNSILFPNIALGTAVAVLQGALAILLFLAAVRIGQVRSGAKLEWKWMAGVSCVFLMALMAFGIGWQQCAVFEDGYHRLLANIAARQSVQREEKSGVLHTELVNYALHVELQTASHGMTAKARIMLKNQGMETAQPIAMTLRECFQVDRVTDITSGQLLHWQRDGSRLLIFPAEPFRQQPIQLEIAYSGVVWEWFMGQYDCPQGLVNFVASPVTLLRSGQAWYPVPGDRQLYAMRDYRFAGLTAVHSIQAQFVSHAPVPFTLTVDMDNDMTVVTNMNVAAVETLGGRYKRRYSFRSQKGQDIFLLAGFYEQEMKDWNQGGQKIPVVASLRHKPFLDDMVKSVESEWLFYRDLLLPPSDNPPVTIVEAPHFLFNLGKDLAVNYRNDLVLRNAIFIDEEYFVPPPGFSNIGRDVKAMQQGTAVLIYWWPGIPTGDMSGRQQVESLVEGFAVYTYALYRNQQDGGRYYEELRQYLMTHPKEQDQNSEEDGEILNGPIGQQVFWLLDDIKQSELGDDGVKTLLRGVHTRFIKQGSLNAADISAVLDGMKMDTQLQASSRQRLAVLAELEHSEGNKKEIGLHVLFNHFHESEFFEHLSKSYH